MTLATIDTIKRALVERIETLAQELVPLGHYADNRSEWQDASTQHGGLGNSFKIRLTGAKAGIWSHFGGGRSGDVLSLVAYLKTDDEFGRAVQWSRAWLGWTAETVIETDRATAEEAHRATERVREAEHKRAARRRGAAVAIWLEAEPKLRDTPAAAYLKERRIDLDVLAKLGGGKQPGALRYHPGTLYPYAHEGEQRLWPALVAAVCKPSDRREDPVPHIGTTRTYLAADDAGRWGKAPVPDPKLSLGQISGGAIFLWRGLRHGRAGQGLIYGRTLGDLWRRGPADEDEGTLVVTEGIEDGLTAALALPRWRVWCGVSLAAMASLRIPSCFQRRILVVDNDPETRTLPNGKTVRHPARVARDRVITAWQRSGREVLIAEPPPGVKDLNDLHRRHADV